MKQVKDFKVTHSQHYNDMYSLLRVTPADGAPLPDIDPGQFVQTAVETPAPPDFGQRRRLRVKLARPAGATCR